MIIRIRYKQIGGHIRCNVFIAKAQNMTFAKTGEIVLREEEWNEFRDQLHHAVEFVPSESDPIRL